MLPMAKEWMTLSQEKYSAIFGWALLGIVALVSFSIVTRLVIRFVFPQKVSVEVIQVYVIVVFVISFRRNSFVLHICQLHCCTSYLAYWKSSKSAVQ